MEVRIFTVGHSTRTLVELGELLLEYGVEVVVDVRKLPRSRTNPQFNRSTLPGDLKKIHVGYRHFSGLAGLRRSSVDSPNKVWRNPSFRGYADYMQTPAFDVQLARLIALSRKKRLALMCAESVPWRCHRSLIADALTCKHIPVVDIFSATYCRRHALPEFARKRKGKVVYPLRVDATY